jgi:hypothetical protein
MSDKYHDVVIDLHKVAQLMMPRLSIMSSMPFFYEL